MPTDFRPYTITKKTNSNKKVSFVSLPSLPPMEPWNAVLEKLTEPRYRIESCWGSGWWCVLASHTSNAGGSPLTVALVAQIPSGSRTYKLELGGKDCEALTMIVSKIPTSMDSHSRAFRFRYERITFAWVYYSKSLFLSFPFLSFPSPFLTSVCGKGRHLIDRALTTTRLLEDDRPAGTLMNMSASMLA